MLLLYLRLFMKKQEEFQNNFDFIAQQLGINLDSSEDDDDDSQIGKPQIIEEEEEEKKIEEMVDVEDSLTFYQRVIKNNPHGNEADYDSNELQDSPNNTSLQPSLNGLTVSPSNRSDSKDK